MIPYLTACDRLEMIGITCLGEGGLTDDGVSRLKAALPDCQIWVQRHN